MGDFVLGLHVGVLVGVVDVFVEHLLAVGVRAEDGGVAIEDIDLLERETLRLLQKVSTDTSSLADVDGPRGRGSTRR